MELKHDDSFDPTPKLKSSPVPISFISFNKHDENCIRCGDIYTETTINYQKYCKKCLSGYLTNITDENIYLDVYIFTRNLECNEHEISRTKEPQNIQECCRNCLEILFFKQVPNNYYLYGSNKFNLNDNVIESEKNCKYGGNKFNLNVIESEKNCNLCRKEFHETHMYFTLCSDCYLISSGYTESTLTKKPIPIIYLPYWYSLSNCEACNLKLKFTSDCQKYCENCFIFYTGCRYCLTTNFNNSQGISKYFLNELKSNQHCYALDRHIIRTYGFTKDPKSDDYILVMQYASGGDLHNFLRKQFTEITWNHWNEHKISTLWQIARGLETIHKANFIHRDFHSGNILIDLSYDKAHQWQIGDLGLSQHEGSASSNNEIYGVIPYIAPEIFKGSTFSKESDVYCVGMIMWELTTGCKPFANVEHDISLIYKILDGERPEITKDTPECYANLMKSCWDPDPKKRPSITGIRKIFYKWYYRNENLKQFNRAEIKRKELINLKELGPEFNGKTHPSAIYTSRPLRSFISRCSSYFSKDYNSIELELDIDIKSSNILEKKRNIEELEINSYGNSGKHIKIETT
ncbi:kinase-like protein [Rhizophagus irregularis]|nr:kinase-like protein [Rhizophagus irregularis]